MVNAARRTIVAAIALLLGLIAGQALAQPYPDRQIRLIYPYTAGGSGDALARVFADGFSTVLGQQMFVDNRPGAGGNTGFAAAARSRADGYTLASVSPAFVINATLYTDPGYDPTADFVAVAPLSVVPNVLIVNAARPFRTLREIVDYAKANPGKLSFGSSGIGTSIHLGAELLKHQAGIDMAHIPYRGAAQAGLDLLGGQIDLMFDSAPTALGNVRTGKARAIVVASSARLAELPDVPTSAEAGFPDLISEAWTGIVAPANTPSAVVDRLAAAAEKLKGDPAIVERLAKLGGRPLPGSSADFATFMKAERARNAVVIKATGMRVE